MAINYTLLFDRIRAIVAALDTQQAIPATIETAVDDVLTEYSGSLVTAAEYSAVQAVVASSRAERNQGGLRNALINLIGQEVVRQVVADVLTFRGSTNEAITELIRQMKADSESVDACTTGISVGTASGKARFLGSLIDVDGVQTERVFAETAAITASSTGLAITTQTRVQPTDPDWPAGSQLSLSLPVSSIGGLVANGTFDAESTTETYYPDLWQVLVGTVGTTIIQTQYSTQTVTLSGDPTEGWYNLTLTDADGNVQTTEPIAWNAEASTIESAINSLTGWDVDVATTGTAPNLVHTITFNQAGTPSTLTVHNETDGTITPAAGSSVDTGGSDKLAMVWVGNGSELTSLEQRMTLQPSTVYAVALRLKREAAATGVIRLRLVDGTNTVLDDDAGTANTVSQDVSTVSTSAFDWVTAFFRTPSVLPDVVKLNIALTTALANTKKLYIDSLTMVEARQLGTLGAWFALIEGDAPPAFGDSYSLSFTNNRAGNIQTRFVRHFGRQLPSDNSGSETILD